MPGFPIERKRRIDAGDFVAVDAHCPHGKFTLFFRLGPGVDDAPCPFTSGVVAREQSDFDISGPGRKRGGQEQVDGLGQRFAGAIGGESDGFEDFRTQKLVVSADALLARMNEYSVFGISQLDGLIQKPEESSRKIINTQILGSGSPESKCAIH